MRGPSAGAASLRGEASGRKAGSPGAGARGSRPPRVAGGRVCIAGSALDPAGAVATGSGPARRASPRQGAALLLGRGRRLLWAAQLSALERDDRRGGTGPSALGNAPGVPRRRLTPRHGPARDQRVRPLAGRPGCGWVGHRGPAHRSIAPLGLAGQQANR